MTSIYGRWMDSPEQKAASAAYRVAFPSIGIHAADSAYRAARQAWLAEHKGTGT